MKFTYETQGAITYLVCELDSMEQMDSLTLGMITNNRIQGLAPVIYTEMNGQRFLKYNISAKVTVEQFFCGNMNKQRTLTAISNILSALCSADEYMIDPNCFSAVPEHIFLNVSNCEAALICVPVMSDRNINSGISELFKKILFSTQFDQNEDSGYITQLITYLNEGSFTIYGLNDLVIKLQTTASPAQMPIQKPPMQSAIVPPSAFDSTISIDDMPASMGGKQPVQVPVQKPPVQPAPVSAPINRPVTPPMAPPPVQPSRPVPPVAPPAPAPAQQPAMRQTVRPQTPPANVPKPPVANGPGFAIPGQAAAPVAQTAPAKPKKEKAESAAPQTGDKKMTFFGLLANYSKENKALYKAQKEASKKNKPAPSAAMPVAPNQGKQPVVPQKSGQPLMQPVYAQQQFRPAVQPVPVQNSFNETTVLSPMMAGGETTVLGADPSMPDPRLIRTKTGERISINKPVFRIGKERSYVDYFIGDNTAISRSHCNIHTENGEYFIEDTNSTNHTYINGKIITSNVKTKLTSGDKVKLANEDFIFSV